MIFFLFQVTFSSINETCDAFTFCLNSQYLKCLNGLCQCDNYSFWNQTMCGKKYFSLISKTILFINIILNSAKAEL